MNITKDNIANNFNDISSFIEVFHFNTIVENLDPKRAYYLKTK